MEGIEEGTGAVGGGEVTVVGADVAAVGVVEAAGLEVAVVGEEAESCAGHAAVEAALGGVCTGMTGGCRVFAGVAGAGTFAGGCTGMGAVGVWAGGGAGDVSVAGLEALEDAGFAGDVGTRKK